MADKKMNQFPTASDVGYIYAETTSGEQVRISKADLAAVVAGLLGAVTKQGRASGNADNLSIGIYNFYMGDNASTNNYPCQYGTLICFNIGTAIQIASNSYTSSPAIYARFLWDSWSPWQRLM